MNQLHRAGVEQQVRRVGEGADAAATPRISQRFFGGEVTSVIPATAVYSTYSRLLVIVVGLSVMDDVFQELLEERHVARLHGIE